MVESMKSHWCQWDQNSDQNFTAAMYVFQFPQKRQNKKIFKKETEPDICFTAEQQQFCFVWYLCIVLPLCSNTITNLIKCNRGKYVLKWDVKTDVFFSSEENEGITLSNFGLRWHTLYHCFLMKSLLFHC